MKQIVFVHVAEEGLLKFDEPKPAAACDCLITENRMSSHPEAFQTIGAFVNCHQNLCPINLQSEPLTSR